MQSNVLPDNASKANDGLLIRARALCGAGRLAWYELDLKTARARLEQGLLLFRQGGDRFGSLEAISSLILVLTWQGEHASALARLEEGMSIQREMPDRQKLLPALVNLCWAASWIVSEESLPQAWELGEEVAPLARAADDKRGLAWALDSLATCCYFRGDHEEARPLIEESAALFEALGEIWGAAHMYWTRASVARRQGCYGEARTFYVKTITTTRHVKNVTGTPYSLEGLAYLAIAEGQPQRAVRLLAAAQCVRERYPSAQQPLIFEEYQRQLSTLRSMLDAAELQAAWAQGRAMTRDEAIEYALKNDDA